MTPPALLHALAGAPAMPGCQPVAPQPCWLCGATVPRGADRVRWMGASFTGQADARAQGAAIVCEPCVWVCAWTPPPGYQQPADGKGVNLRLFSHCYDAGTYAYANKASKPMLLAWLRAPKRGPWFCALADSGQKHVLPWTPVNLDGAGAGRVRFEARDVWLGDWALVDVLTEGLTRGVTKEEIGTGRYAARSYTHGLEWILAFERCHGARRGSGWFALALWLAQRDEARWQEGQDDRRCDAERARALRAGAARGVSGGGRERPDALGPDDHAHANGGRDDRDRQRVGDGAATQAAACGGQQGELFGAGGPVRGRRLATRRVS